MRTLARLFLAFAGIGGSLAFAYYVDPFALDVLGFILFYTLLLMGSYNAFLLLQLRGLQAFLLADLLIAFLFLRQLHLFTWWGALALIFVVILIERYGSGNTRH